MCFSLLKNLEVNSSAEDGRDFCLILFRQLSSAQLRNSFTVSFKPKATELCMFFALILFFFLPSFEGLNLFDCC